MDILATTPYTWLAMASVLPFPVSFCYTNPATESELTSIGPITVDRRYYPARAS
jgi:hypothetical protein